MRTSPTLICVALAALTPGCVGNIEDLQVAPSITGAEEVQNAPTPEHPTLAPRATATARRPLDPSCPSWGCGTNHNRRIVRLLPA